MDIIFLIYCLLIAAAVIPRKREKPDYLSVECTTGMRGIAAIGIILHHMAERTAGGFLFSRLVMVGYLLVSFFFFLSGYGLLVQYRKKGESYLHGFLKSQVLYLVVIYILDVLLYDVFDCLMGNPHTLAEIAKAIVFSGIAKNAWYMIVQILCYLAFYFVFRCRAIKTLRAKILVVFLLQTAFCLLCILHGVSSVWYLSNYGFSLGLLWAYQKDRIDSFLNRRYAVGLLIAVLLFCGFYGSPVMVDRFIGGGFAKVFRTVCRLISSPLSVALVIVIGFRLKPVLKLWNWVGSISLEIYLLHGLVYSILRSRYIFVESEILWTVLTVVLSVALAYPVSKLNRMIAGWLKSGRRAAPVR